LADHYGQFTHKVVTYQPQIGCRAGKVRWPKTDVLTAEPCSQVSASSKWKH